MGVVTSDSEKAMVDNGVVYHIKDGCFCVDELIECGLERLDVMVVAVRDDLVWAIKRPESHFIGIAVSEPKLPLPREICKEEIYIDVELYSDDHLDDNDCFVPEKIGTIRMNRQDLLEKWDSLTPSQWVNLFEAVERHYLSDVANPGYMFDW